MEIDHEEQHLINGSLMKKYTGKVVRVWLNIGGNASTGGRKVQGVTTDKKTINVALETPLNQPLSGWIEVIGTPVENGNTINCSEIIVFPSDENSEPLDEEAHNGIVSAMDNMRQFYETGENLQF